MVEVKGPRDGRICFCGTLCDGDTIVCSNKEYPYERVSHVMPVSW